MDLDSPRESMSTDTNDSASRDDSQAVEMNPYGSSGARTPFESHPLIHDPSGSIQVPIIRALPSYQLPDHEQLPASDDPPRLMVPAPSSLFTAYPGETGSSYETHRLTRQQHTAILPGLRPSVQATEVTSRKRKQLHDLPHIDITTQDDILHDDARSRIRPRLRRHQDGEFSPLLIISPVRDRHSLAEEETISTFHYPQNIVGVPSHTIHRYFGSRDSTEHGPRMLPSRASTQINDTESPEERSRSDSASSFAEVALASATTRTLGRLSTLSDIWLPRPFEDTEQPSQGSIMVHERGLDAPPPFFTSSGGRMGGVRASGERTDALGHPIRSLEPSAVRFFDEPLCESPDSISPDGDGVAHFGLPATAPGAHPSG